MRVRHRFLLSLIFCLSVGPTPSSTGRSEVRVQTNRSEGVLESLAQANITEEDLSPDLPIKELATKIKTTHRIFTALFRLKTNVLFFEEVARPSAFAMKSLDKDNFPDGSILLGTKLINQVNNLPGNSDLILNSIIAHEMAHLVQFNNNSPLNGQLLELQADYIAGWSIRNYSTGEKINTSDFQEKAKRVLEDFYGRGDFAYNESSHHGTPLQRMGAMLAGILSKESNPDKAYNEGLAYVKSITKSAVPARESAVVQTIVSQLKRDFVDAEGDAHYSILSQEDLFKAIDKLPLNARPPRNFTSGRTNGCTVWVDAKGYIYKVPLGYLAIPKLTIDLFKNPAIKLTSRSGLPLLDVWPKSRDSIVKKKQAELVFQIWNAPLAAVIKDRFAKAISLCQEPDGKDSDSDANEAAAQHLPSCRPPTSPRLP
jgi:hypothetical protein